MKITYEQGDTLATSEIKDYVTCEEAVELFIQVMQGAGFHRDSVIRCFGGFIEEEELNEKNRNSNSSID